jgi:hypothetical protein
MMKKLLLAAVTFSLVAMIAAPAAAQTAGTDPGSASVGPAASGAGVLKKAQFRSEPAQLNFTGLATVIADTVVLTASGCILTEFHAEMCEFGGPENGQSTQYRTLIGGVLGEGHSAFGFVFISPDGNSNGLFDVSGYNSWRCGLAPGTYSILVQGAQAITGTSCVRGRTLTTSWKK